MSYELWNAGRLPDGAAMTTSASTTSQTFTLDDLKLLEREIASMPQPKWTLIAPDGRFWQDTDPQALLRVLAMAVYRITPFSEEPQSPTTTGGEKEHG